MSIEEFGNSLLSNQRQYNEDMYQKRRKESKEDSKDQLKDMLKMRLAGAAVSGLVNTGLNIANDVVRDRTQHYVNTSSVLDKKALMGNANATIKNVLNTEQQMLAHKGGAAAYFEELAGAEIESQMDKVSLGLTTGEYSDIQLSNVQAIAAAERGRELHAAFKQTLSKARQLAASGSTDLAKFQTELDKRRPTTIGSFVANKVRGLFSGTDPVRNSIENLVDVTAYDDIKDVEYTGYNSRTGKTTVKVKKADILFAYDNLFNKDIVAADRFANAKAKIEATTGQPFSWGDADKTFGDIEDIKIQVQNPLTLKTDEKTISVRQLYLNGVPQNQYVSPLDTSKPVQEKVVDNNPVNYNLQGSELEDAIQQQIADTLNPAMTQLDNNGTDRLKWYVQARTGKQGAPYTTDTAGADDAQDNMIMNDIYGKLLITRRTLSGNFSVSDQTANELATKMHVFNFDAMVDTDEATEDAIVEIEINGKKYEFLKHWDKADEADEYNTEQSVLNGSLRNNQAGTWNSAVAMIVLQEEAARTGNTEALGITGYSEINDLYNNLSATLETDLKTTSLDALGVLLYRVNELIIKFEADSSTAVNARKLKILELSLKNRYDTINANKTR